ncbi:unnamed protein product [Colias eurytheme]|nr:unnamed protein product [Colias eurytheme]
MAIRRFVKIHGYNLREAGVSCEQFGVLTTVLLSGSRNRVEANNPAYTVPRRGRSVRGHCYICILVNMPSRGLLSAGRRVTRASAHAATHPTTCERSVVTGAIKL